MNIDVPDPSPTRSRQEDARFGFLFELSCALAEHRELDTLVPLVIDRCCEALQCQGASVLLLDPARHELYFPWVRAETEEATRALLDLRFPADKGIAGEVLRTGQPHQVAADASDPRMFRGADARSGVQTDSMLAVPLRGQEQAIGVLEAINYRHGGTFPDGDLDFLTAMAGCISIAIENAQLFETIRRSEAQLRTQVASLNRDLARNEAFREIVGTTPPMQEVFRLMESAAASPITVLLEGETGTGKELAARAIHHASPRNEGPFLVVNCAAIPEHLLESELFGHRRGAFTGADSDRSGYFEAAESGTLFLDEIGEMPQAMQAKVLRVLQEHEVTPVGERRARPIDVRVISATHRDLQAEVTAGRFREDLFYRISAFPITLPALRERAGDIPLLATRMLEEIGENYDKTLPGLSPEAASCLAAYRFPGNVRELRNEIERAVALVPDASPIQPSHFSRRLHGPGPDTSAGMSQAQAATQGSESWPDDFREARARFETSFIQSKIRQCDGNATRAAQLMGISRASLHAKLRMQSQESG